MDVAVEYALRHARERPDAPRLVLIGAGTYQPPAEAAEVVFHAGFLDEEERRAAHAEALALVNPSHMESLSIVVIESWLEGTPVLVSSGSEVLCEHLDASGGGFVFDSFESYRDGVERLLEEPALAPRLATAGREYALDTYGWPAVRTRFREAVKQLTA